eukprot:3121119-Pleurochrysis_carterae.AAC.1
MRAVRRDGLSREASGDANRCAGRLDSGPATCAVVVIAPRQLVDLVDEPDASPFRTSRRLHDVDFALLEISFEGLPVMRKTPQRANVPGHAVQGP